MRLLPNMENENDTELGGGGGIGREARSVVFDIRVLLVGPIHFPIFYINIYVKILHWIVIGRGQSGGVHLHLHTKHKRMHITQRERGHKLYEDAKVKIYIGKNQ